MLLNTPSPCHKLSHLLEPSSVTYFMDGPKAYTYFSSLKELYYCWSCLYDATNDRNSTVVIQTNQRERGFDTLYFTLLSVKFDDYCKTQVADKISLNVQPKPAKLVYAIHPNICGMYCTCISTAHLLKDRVLGVAVLVWLGAFLSARALPPSLFVCTPSYTPVLCSR